MLAFFFAMLQSCFNVFFALDLFGVSLGVWCVGFIVFDFILGVTVISAKRIVQAESDFAMWDRYIGYNNGGIRDVPVVKYL